MPHPLQMQALLRAAQRRGWITAYEADQLAARAIEPTTPAEALRKAGAEALAARIGELLPPGSHPGFGRWQPLARLGGGAMGAVWLAAADEGPLVVVKTALSTGKAPLVDGEAGGSVWTGGASENPAPTPADELALRFAREARITAGLQHLRIVPCLDGGLAKDGTRYLVLAWVPAGDLSALLKRDGPLRPACVLAIADQLADALDHAHARGVVHRDLKPANVFIHPDGSVLLGDFGLARPTAIGATRLTLAGVAVGTPNAMAPEQIEGRGAIDGRTDLYALGCLLCECLTGRPPFAGRSAEVMHAHRTAPPPDLDALVPGLPAGFAVLAARLMAKRPEDRPADATSVRAALAPLLASCGAVPGRPVPLREPTAAEQGRALRLEADDGRIFVLWGGERIVLGKQRGPDVDLVVRDYPEAEHRVRLMRISRRHAILAIGGDGLPTVEDLGSANGTWLAGERLSAHRPQRSTAVQELDLAGAVVLRVRPAGERSAVLERGTNRPELGYALVAGSLDLGAGTSDLTVPGATRRVRLAWTGAGWRADGAPLGESLDLGGTTLRCRALDDWL